MSIPTDRVYKHTRNIALERFAAAVTTGWLSAIPADADIADLVSGKHAVAHAIFDIAESLTEEYMRRAEQCTQ
jgi:hypothetical protein